MPKYKHSNHGNSTIASYSAGKKYQSNKKTPKNLKTITAGKAKSKKYAKKVDLEGESQFSGLHDMKMTYTKYAPSTTNKLAKYILTAPPQYYQDITPQIPTGAAQGSQFYYTFPKTIMDSAMFVTLNQGGATTAIAETRVFVEHVNQITEINNYSSSPNEVFIYDLLVKDNLGSGFAPVDTVSAGYNAKYNNTAAYIRPWTLPGESTVFNKYYKVIKQTKVMIKPGECHKHTKFIKYNKFFTSQFISAGVSGGGGTAPLWVKGWTHSTMVRAIGCCQPLTGFANASLSKVEHALVCSTTIKYRTPQGPSTNQEVGIVNSTLDSATQLKQQLPETATIVSTT